MSKEIEALMREALAKAWDEGAQFDPDPASRKNPYSPAPPDPEPATPLNCSACGVSYDICTRNLRKPRGRCCCVTCFTTATHNQHSWEAWDRRQKGRG